MNQQAEDLLMQAPAPVSNAQLRELHIRPNLPKATTGDEPAKE
jgi:aspartyl-tRNA synthetase